MKWLIICIPIIILLALVWHNTKTTPKYMPSSPPAVELASSQDSNIIQYLNDRNEKIKSIYYKLTIRMSGLLQDLDGYLYYEKDKKFRMFVYSSFGLELDIGSNEQYFWFWSKRMKPPILYYCLHKNSDKTRLKTPLNPLWLMELTNINTIDKGAISKYKGKIAVSEVRNGIMKIILVDQNANIIGHYLYDNHLITSCEMTPRTIEIIWPDEAIRMNWTIDYSQINVKIDTNNWQMPDMRRKVDMSSI